MEFDSRIQCFKRDARDVAHGIGDGRKRRVYFRCDREIVEARDGRLLRHGNPQFMAEIDGARGEKIMIAENPEPSGASAAQKARYAGPARLRRIVIQTQNIFSVEQNAVFQQARPETEQEKRTMICMRVDAYAGSEQRSYKKEQRFVIYVITHDDLQRVESGVALGCTRTDYISEQIERIFNRTKMGISDAVLVSNTEEQVDARHPMRVITFTTSGFNGHACV